MVEPGPPRATAVLVATTYLLGVEIHKAHHVAIFLECNNEVHHRGEGEEHKDWGEREGSRCVRLTWAGLGPSAHVLKANRVAVWACVTPGSVLLT